MEGAELRKGPWHEEEDDQLAASVAVLGDKRWDALAKASGIYVCIYIHDLKYDYLQIQRR